MANSFYRAGNFLTIVLDGSTDWDSQTETDQSGSFPVGCRIQYIQFKPASAGNSLIIREGGPNSNVKIVDYTDNSGDGAAINLGMVGVCHPAIKASDMAAGDVVIIHYA